MSDFSFNDLRELQKQENTSDTSIDLTYHKGSSARIRPLRIKDKKNLVKAMETKDEKIIEEAIDLIFQKYVDVDGDVTVEELTLSERIHLLAEIKSLTSGNECNLVHVCPKCEHTNKDIKYDLEQLQVKEISDDDVKNVLFLHNDMVKLHLGQLRNSDKNELDNYCKKKKIKSEIEKQFVLMAFSIHKVEIQKDDVFGTVTMSSDEKVKFFESLPQGILDDINDYMQMTKHGIVIPLDFDCENCDYANPDEEVNPLVFFII